MKCFTIYQNGTHSWTVYGADADRPQLVIDTNQVVIQSGSDALMCDPGGLEVFPSMMAALTEQIPIDTIKQIFLSHQDPDVASALAVWRQVCTPGIKVHLSWMWESFVRHFDYGAAFTAIPDEGSTIRLGNISLQTIPAHYLHSPGNFSLYDPAAKILFSGDLGAALLPHGTPPTGIFVTDFNAHIRFMEGFHRRWLGSPAARDAWVERVAKLDIDILVPQHGLLMRGDDVGRFLDWLSGLEIGSGIAAMRAAG